jgi:hypothetical protein
VCCIAERLHEPVAEADDPLSWESLAATVRRHAEASTFADAQDLLSLADLLDGFAELEKR